MDDVKSHFLDSGAFSLRVLEKEYARKNRTDPYAYYDTKEFWEYADRYISFVKEYSIGIDLYANLDVIPNPELTWRNQQYLERHGLSPVPVVHCGTDLKWLKKYMNSGYDLIGLGGLVGASKGSRKKWLDSAFNIVCDQPSRLPKVRIHGFGVTSCELMLRYPWWSVDSTTWAKRAAYGEILVPQWRSSKFIFSEPPDRIPVAVGEVSGDLGSDHFCSYKKEHHTYRAVMKWLEYLGIPMDGKDGVAENHVQRRYACLRYFEEMRKHLPDWPWPFRPPDLICPSGDRRGDLWSVGFRSDLM